MDVNRISALLGDAHTYVEQRDYVESLLITVKAMDDGTIASSAYMDETDGSQISLHINVQGMEVRDAGA